VLTYVIYALLLVSYFLVLFASIKSFISLCNFQRTIEKILYHFNSSESKFIFSLEKLFGLSKLNRVKVPDVMKYYLHVDSLERR